MDIEVRNGRDHSPNLFHKLLVSLVALSGILGLVLFFIGSENTALAVTTVVCWSFAFVLMLIFDQHNAWISALGFFAVGIITGLMTFADIPHAVELVVLGFIGAVLIALSVNRLYGTFDWMGYLLVLQAKSFKAFLLLSGILGGIIAFLFDEGSSVGLMAMILAPILAGIMVEIGKYLNPGRVEPEEVQLAMRMFAISSMNFVFMTNLLAFVLAIGHPVSLTISHYAHWNLSFWIPYVSPISIGCYLIGRQIFMLQHRKSINELNQFYLGFREYKLGKGFETTNLHKIGLAYLIVMGFLQVTHQSLADAAGKEHEVTLVLFPSITAVIMSCHYYLIDRHKLHGVLDNLPIGEFLNMAGIFIMAHMLSVVGVLGWIGKKLTPLAMSVGGVIILGTLSGGLSALLENLGVAVAINTLVDGIFGGVHNTTPIRMSVMISAMLTGNTFIFASVAGLVGIPLLQAFTSAKLRNYADKKNQIHIYDAYLSSMDQGINVLTWLKSSVPIVIVTVFFTFAFISVVDKTTGYPEGIWYCEYNDSAGCIDEGHNEEQLDNSEAHQTRFLVPEIPHVLITQKHNFLFK